MNARPRTTSSSRATVTLAPGRGAGLRRRRSTRPRSWSRPASRGAGGGPTRETRSSARRRRLLPLDSANARRREDPEPRAARGRDARPDAGRGATSSGNWPWPTTRAARRVRWRRAGDRRARLPRLGRGRRAPGRGERGFAGPAGAGNTRGPGSLGTSETSAPSRRRSCCPGRTRPPSTRTCATPFGGRLPDPPGMPALRAFDAAGAAVLYDAALLYRAPANDVGPRHKA